VFYPATPCARLDACELGLGGLFRLRWLDVDVDVDVLKARELSQPTMLRPAAKATNR